VEWMRGQVTIAPAAQTQWAKRFLRIATLLSQLSAPAPVVVPVGECPHCGYEGEMARVPHAGEGEGWKTAPNAPTPTGNARSPAAFTQAAEVNAAKRLKCHNCRKRFIGVHRLPFAVVT